MRPLGSAYLVSPCSSAPFRWGRRSCLGLRTGVSPHFSMNSMREILALRGGYERGRVPLPSPMPPESGAPPHNTHPSMVPPRHPRRPSPLFFVLLTLSPAPSSTHTHYLEPFSPSHYISIFFSWPVTDHCISRKYYPTRDRQIIEITNDHL